MSAWSKYNIEGKIIEILKGARTDNNPKLKDHHFGDYSYMTPYQIAIRLKKILLNENNGIALKDLGEDVGGKDFGSYTSLSQIIARNLSQRCKNDAINIEGAFIHVSDAMKLSFKDDENKRIEMSHQSKQPLSLFRYQKR